MSPEQREALRRLYRFCCGYCGVSETDVGAELTVDHFQPRSRDGLHEPANWVYCCHACNEFKGDYWQPDSPQRILHPLQDDLAEHIVEQEDGALVGLTETGTFHIECLRLNRASLVAHRLRERQIAAERAEQHALYQRLQDLEQRLRETLERLERV